MHQNHCLLFNTYFKCITDKVQQLKMPALQATLNAEKAGGFSLHQCQRALFGCLSVEEKNCEQIFDRNKDRTLQMFFWKGEAASCSM